MKIDILARNLMILASAGSGKTFQLGNRVVGLVGSEGVDPESIVALTFTRKAAGEFADSVLSKLGEAALDPAKAEELKAGLGREIDVDLTLGRIVRVLPRFQLGTMDSFFAKVVRGFQYELGLTGGSFELVQGSKLDAALEEILGDILGDALDEGASEDFLHSFRRATLGRDERGVSRALGGFFRQWHGLWKSGLAGGVFEPAEMVDVRTWEERKGELSLRLMKAAEGISWTDKRQPDAFGKLVEMFGSHAIGSGTFSKAGKLFECLTTWMAEGGSLELRHFKPFEAGPVVEGLLGEIMRLLAACELSAAVLRTRSVMDLVRWYDLECERRLRRRGMLGFDDVKFLMGRWIENEEQRLRREAVDFRLDARYQHWLLDEFQDTSRAEWRGLEPLLDEAASDPAGSLFVVGDVKQAIYGWRGGEVGLFGEVRQRYGSGMTVASMPESWRSCGPVLDLVNRVCGDRDTIAALFGDEVASRWEWEEHVPARAGLSGEGRVEVLGREAGERHDRMVAILRELGVGRRALGCGVLVRSNEQVRVIAERLRTEGFDVIEEGVRRPGEDHPVGVAMLALLGWLADPADDFRREVVGMSPLEEILRSRYDSDWKRWESLLEIAMTAGFAGMLRGVISPLREGWSDFGRIRAEDVLGALAAFDASGGTGARAACKWVEGLEISQSPGTAAVQVMTIHKSKGLGFDVVILPEVEDKQVPDAGKYSVSSGEGWVLQNPPVWVRAQVPELRDAERRWGDDQCYEAMCLLYVALTRAKRGLYVLLPEEPESRKEAFSSPAGWLRQSLGLGGGRMSWQSGDAGWFETVPDRVLKPESSPTRLVPAMPLRLRATPSGAKKSGAGRVADSPSGKAFGSEVHALFEQVGWLDEELPRFPGSDAGRLVADVLEVPDIRAVFERKGREIGLFREQAVEAILDGQWLSGVIDRLHVHEGGRRVEVIDFKTDAVASPLELVERYRGQMNVYRRVLEGIYPGADIECLLLSTRLATWVRL